MGAVEYRAAIRVAGPPRSGEVDEGPFLAINADGSINTVANLTLESVNIAQETGGNLDAIKAKTDNLDVVLSSRATEATLATRATESTLATRASEATLATRATEATLATRGSESTLATRLSESDFDTKTGSLTETAPATDTASSGVNGRLQRIAQRLTALVGLLPAALDVNGRLITVDQFSDLAVTATAAEGSGATLTMPAAGSGLFHYITRIEITANTAPVALGANARATVTTTNLPGSPAFTVGVVRNGGGTDRIDANMTRPLRSLTANTDTTIVGPATANCLWRLNVHYYTGL